IKKKIKKKEKMVQTSFILKISIFILIGYAVYVIAKPLSTSPYGPTPSPGPIPPYNPSPTPTPSPCPGPDCNITWDCEIAAIDPNGCQVYSGACAKREDNSGRWATQAECENAPNNDCAIQQQFTCEAKGCTLYNTPCFTSTGQKNNNTIADGQIIYTD